MGVEQFLDMMAKASNLRWYGHVLRNEDENVIVKALKFEVRGDGGRGRPKQTWIKQIENDIKKNGLVTENELLTSDHCCTSERIVLLTAA